MLRFLRSQKMKLKLKFLILWKVSKFVRYWLDQLADPNYRGSDSLTRERECDQGWVRRFLPKIYVPKQFISSWNINFCMETGLLQLYGWLFRTFAVLRAPQRELKSLILFPNYSYRGGKLQGSVVGHPMRLKEDAILMNLSDSSERAARTRNKNFFMEQWTELLESCLWLYLRNFIQPIWTMLIHVIHETA